MRSIRPIQAAKGGYLVMSAFFCVFGILLMVLPNLSISMIGWITGIVLMVFGIVKVIGYLSKDLYRLAFQYDLAFGIFLIVLGILVLSQPEQVMNFVCVVLGIAILADGLFKIQIALDARPFGIRSWWLILALAILAGVVGTLLVFRPTESARMLTILLGLSMLAEGILNISVMLCAVKIIRHQQRDIIDEIDILD